MCMCRNPINRITTHLVLGADLGVCVEILLIGFSHIHIHIHTHTHNSNSNSNGNSINKITTHLVLGADLRADLGV